MGSRPARVWADWGTTFPPRCAKLSPMKPSLGRIVLFHDNSDNFRAMNNYATECPAIVVRVWSDTCVNLRLVLDGEAVEWRTSVVLDAERAQGVGWSWPERV